MKRQLFYKTHFDFIINEECNSLIKLTNKIDELNCGKNKWCYYIMVCDNKSFLVSKSYLDIINAIKNLSHFKNAKSILVYETFDVEKDINIIQLSNFKLPNNKLQFGILTSIGQLGTRLT
jgi:hypothetical protein